MFPELSRVASDIKKFPRAHRAIEEANGDVINSIDGGNIRRLGRRKNLRKLSHHPHCDKGVAMAREKWEAFHGGDDSVLSSDDEEDIV